MQGPLFTRLGVLAVGAMLAVAAPSMAVAQNSTEKPADAHDHAHDDHADDQAAKAAAIYNGYFEDSEVQVRPLSDWQGDWQSVYPLLTQGVLDPVMADKAAHGDMTAQEYRDYYEIGYKTDVNRIVIDGDRVAFYRDGGNATEGVYASDGYEILTYKKGNRGVRHIFKKTGGDEAAPQFIQFSDHAIAPVKAHHYHLYWGDDRAEVLKELTNWPTYYPVSLTAEQVAAEMMAH